MLAALLLVSIGLIVGRLRAYLRTQINPPQCPRCAIEDQLQQHLTEVAAIKRRGEARMRRIAAEYPNRQPPA